MVMMPSVLKVSLLTTIIAPGLCRQQAGDQVPLSKHENSPFSDSFDNFVAENLAYWHVPGFSIAVVDGDKTYSKVCPVSARLNDPD